MICPRSPEAENSVEFGAPRNTDHPQLRQPLALEVWKSIVKSTDVGSKITILTNGPLTTLAKIILADAMPVPSFRLASLDVFIVGGHIGYHRHDKGNVINVPLNIYAEMNMFLDPLAAKVVFDSMLDVTLIPLSMQRKVCVFPHFIKKLDFENKTPEARFSRRLLKRMYQLQQRNHRYQHMDTFLGEILGAGYLNDRSTSFKSYLSANHSRLTQQETHLKMDKLPSIQNKGNQSKYCISSIIVL
ncbi:putative inosine/uridine-preferring nucleoside hydrolase domain, ribonucleoside hydrolase [Helianthus annuus]|nr:putative inosine/uridine-preferring nucleoside hydrolase domain, ribonucleoside hydrolase [Helianthus annuus]